MYNATSLLFYLECIVSLDGEEYIGYQNKSKYGKACKTQDEHNYCRLNKCRVLGSDSNEDDCDLKVCGETTT